MELGVDEAPTRGLHRYIGLVAAALGQHGAAHSVRLDPPVTAYLMLARRLPEFPDHHTELVWYERHGWAVALQLSRDDLVTISYLGIDVLPAPRVVAGFAERMCDGAFPGLLRAPVLCDPDGPDLPMRLTGYAWPTHSPDAHD